MYVIWINSFYLFIFVFQNTVAQRDEVCGQVALTYFLKENRIAARLSFAPITQLAWYRWTHFFIENGPKPNFDFQEALRINSSKYEKQNFSIIIKDLHASDNGVYTIECKDINGRHLFSASLKINTPYTIETTPSTSTFKSVPTRSGYVWDKTEINADLKPTAKKCNLCKTVINTKTYSDGISTTDEVLPIQTDSTLKQTANHEITDTIVTGISPNTIAAELAQEEKLLTKASILLASGCTIAGVILTLVVVVIVKKTSSRRSNGEYSNRTTHGFNLTAMTEHTPENASNIVIDVTKRELRSLSDPNLTQDPYSTLTFVNETIENVYSELEEESVNISQYKSQVLIRHFY